MNMKDIQPKRYETPIDEDFVKSALMHEKARRERQAIKPKTNFDRITESVESLAEFLYELRGCYVHSCYKCPLLSIDECNEKGIKEWLQKECEQ